MTGSTSNITTDLLGELRAALDRADRAPTLMIANLSRWTAAGYFRRLDDLLSRGELPPADWSEPDLDPD